MDELCCGNFLMKIFPVEKMALLAPCLLVVPRPLGLAQGSREAER